MILQYVRRICKTFINFIILLGICLLFIVLMSKQTSQGDYSLLLKDRGFINMMYFVGFVSLFYPLLAYAKKKVYLNRSFSEEKEEIMELFASLRYQLTKEEEGKLYFRPISKLYRIRRLFEDTITVSYDDGSVELEGMRKDVFRLARYIEQRYVEKS